MPGGANRELILAAALPMLAGIRRIEGCHDPRACTNCCVSPKTLKICVQRCLD